VNIDGTFFYLLDNPSSGLGISIDIVHMEMLGKEHIYNIIKYIIKIFDYKGTESQDGSCISVVANVSKLRPRHC